MRLSVLVAFGLIAACQQPAEPTADPSADAPTQAGTLIGNSAPATREAALQLMDRRQDRMEDIGDATKVLGRETRKDQPDLTAVRTAANTIATLAPQVAAWFPAGTGPDVGDTDALPTIWEKPEDFAQKTRDFDAAAKAFKAATDGGDVAAIRASFAALGKSCKACHDDYREKDD